MRRRLIIVGVSLLAVSALIFTIQVRVYMLPQVDSQKKSDAILVLGPPTKSRIALAKSMAEKGLAHYVLISTPSGFNPSICQSHPAGYTIVCFAPDPSTTQGEAQELRALAKEHKWKSVTVVTFTPQVARARVIVQRCFAGTVNVVADSTKFSPLAWAYQFLYQSLGFVKVFLRTGC